ncbi:MAG: GxxExxY protein [Proteobacteria bacterium]|nr:GxxExxY protein [Pseudomonadota bacterium]
MRGDRGDDDGAVSDPLTHSIIEAIIRVHSVLGPGFLESVYQRALAVELTDRCNRVRGCGRI